MKVGSQTSQNLAGLGHYDSREQVTDSRKVTGLPPIHDIVTSMNKPEPVQNGKSVDTVSSSKSKMEKTKAGFWSSFLKLFGIGKSESTDDKGGKADEAVARPSIEKPSDSDMECSDQLSASVNKALQISQQIEKDMDEMIGKKPMNETKTMKLFIQCLMDQRKSLGEIADVTSKIIITLQEDNRELEKNFLDGKSEYRKAQRNAKIASWVGNALSIATGVVAVAAWVLTTLSTGGAAAIPAGILLGETFLGVSSAASQITSSVLDYQSGGKHAALIGMEEAREMTNDQIQKLMDDLNQQLDKIQASWSQQRQVLQNIYNVARMA